MQSRTTPYSPHCLHPPFPTCRCHPRAPAGQQQVNEEKLLFVLGCADSSSSSCLHHRELRPVAHGSAPILSALSPLTSRRCGKVRSNGPFELSQIEFLWVWEPTTNPSSWGGPFYPGNRIAIFEICFLSRDFGLWNGSRRGRERCRGQGPI